jgi:ParB-like chromosome segregation protein Spo0J
MTTQKKPQIATKTYTECTYNEIEPNPLNPRRIFDKSKLDVLEESIRDKKILVPLMAASV